MIIRDWRELRPGSLANLYESERALWMQRLRWDLAAAWREVEQARTTWGLPGLVALNDAGELCGAAFYLHHDDRFDIGGISAVNSLVAGALIDGMLTNAIEAGVNEVRCFVFDPADWVRTELAARGLQVDRYRYLIKSLERGAGDSRPEPRSFQAWRDSDVDAVAALLHASYDDESARVFAPRHERSEWRQYVNSIVEFTAVGEISRDLSCVVREQGAVNAVALVTMVSAATAHLAQLSVHPAHRGRGVARGMLDQVADDAAWRGCSTMTLLVAEGNSAAGRLYDSAGFVEAASFVAATGQPRRLTSVALASVGAITRR